MCWGLPTPGEDTESLVTEGFMVEIQPSELGAGDAIGICGPGSLGAAGHIMLVQAVRPTGIDIIEQAGGQLGPIYRTLKRIPTGYRAYRCVKEGDSVPVLTANNPVQGELDAWRLAAFVTGSPETEGGPNPGESVWLVKAIADLSAAVRRLEEKATHGGASADEVADELAARLAA